jgi:hypothetical protein
MVSLHKVGLCDIWVKDGVQSFQSYLNVSAAGERKPEITMNTTFDEVSAGIEDLLVFVPCPQGGRLKLGSQEEEKLSVSETQRTNCRWNAVDYCYSRFKKVVTAAK